MRANFTNFVAQGSEIKNRGFEAAFSGFARLQILKEFLHQGVPRPSDFLRNFHEFRARFRASICFSVPCFRLAMTLGSLAWITKLEV